jgi:RNA polymerase sigma factor (sigma-70 family)
VSLPPFQHVIDQFSRDVHRFLVMLVGPHAADDCFQETFLAALRGYTKLRKDSNISAWLLTIARSKAVDSWRKEQQQNRVADRLIQVDSGHATSPPLDHQVDNGLWRLVGVLPDKQKLTVAYRYAVDCSYAEIATALEISEAAARQNVAQGLKKMRMVMENG